MSYVGANQKSKYFKIGHFEISHILKSSICIVALRIWYKNTCKTQLLNCYLHQRFPNFKILFFSKSTFHRTVMTSTIKAPNFCWKNMYSHLENSKNSIMNFWPNWSILICWVTFTNSNVWRPENGTARRRSVHGFPTTKWYLPPELTKTIGLYYA